LVTIQHGVYIFCKIRVNCGHIFCSHTPTWTQFWNCDHQWKQSNKCGQDWKHFYFVTLPSHRISMGEMLPKLYTKCCMVHFCTQNTVATKVYTFPLPGYNFGDIPKLWTQFLAQFTWLATKASHPYVCTSISFQWFLLN